MHAALQAAQNVDAANKSEPPTNMATRLAQAREQRMALPSAKVEVYANNFAQAIAERKAEVERMFDERTVDLAQIEAVLGRQIEAEAALLSDLMKQVEESRARLSRLETGKVREKAETNEFYDREIAEARRTIKALESASAILAKPAEDQ